MRQAMEDLSLDHLWVIYPGDKTYALEKNITVLPLADMGRIRDFSKAP